MSAFVVDTACMSKVVAAICYKGRYGHIIRTFGGIATSDKDAPTRIGRLLFTLNVEAVMQRYPDTQDNPGDLPGTHDAACLSRTFRAAPVSLSMHGTRSLIPCMKAMRCLAYQCSEGDVPERAALYRELQAAIGEVAEHIVEGMPEYDQARWG